MKNSKRNIVGLTLLGLVIGAPILRADDSTVPAVIVTHDALSGNLRVNTVIPSNDPDQIIGVDQVTDTTLVGDKSAVLSPNDPNAYDSTGTNNEPEFGPKGTETVSIE